MLDSIELGALSDALQQAFPHVDMSSWLMSASQDGGDTLAGLVEFLDHNNRK